MHSLDLTQDPAVFAAMQHQLAATNISALTRRPGGLAMFSPALDPPQRIEVARTWGSQHGDRRTAAGLQMWLVVNGTTSAPARWYRDLRPLAL